MVDVVEANEISLGGVSFPVRGPIRYANISVVPNPVILGDVSRASDTQIMSQLILPDASEGIGLNVGDARIDQKRAWTSEAETRYRRQITLPNLVTDLGRPAGETAPPFWIGEYNSLTYVVFGPRIYSLSGTTWTLQHTLLSQPTGVLVYQNRLFVTSLTEMEWQEDPHGDPASGYTPGAWYTVPENPASLFYAQGEQAFRWLRYGGPGLNPTIPFWFTKGSTRPDLPDTSAAGTPSTWGVHVQSGLPIDVFKIVPVVPQGSGAVGTYYIARNGIYYNTSLGLTPLAVTYGPLQPGQFGRTAILYKADLVFPTGELGLLAYRPGSNAADVRPIGLDQEDGVPGDRWGVINDLAVGGGYLYALITHEGLDGTSPRDISVMAFDGAHWHPVASLASGLMTTTGTSVQGHILVALPSGLYVGHMRSDGTPAIKRIDERPRAVTPKQVGVVSTQTRFNFAEGPVDHVTPWYDLGSPIQQKLLTRLELMVRGLSATETVTVSYALDQDETTWAALDTLVQDGLTVVRLNGTVGVAANFVRFKYSLRRATGVANAYRRPLIEFAVLHWARLLPAQYGFSAEIDLTKRWKGRTPLQLAREVERLSDPERSPQLIPFTYEEDLGGERRTRWVKVSRMTGTSETGRKLVAQGSVFISLMAPYADDNV